MNIRPYFVVIHAQLIFDKVMNEGKTLTRQDELILALANDYRMKHSVELSKVDIHKAYAEFRAYRRQQRQFQYRRF